MKKIYGIIIVLLIVCTSCSQNPEKLLEGYWMNESGNTLSFTSENECTANGEQYNYKIYDTDHIQIYKENTCDISEGVFYFEDGYFYLKDPAEEEYIKYTKDEEEQKQILKQIENQKKIEELENQIVDYQNKIADLEERISNNESDIKNWEQNIQWAKEECQQEIEFGSDREYHENLRDEHIATYEEAIRKCEERIVEFKNEIKKYEQTIETIMNQISEYRE